MPIRRTFSEWYKLLAKGKGTFDRFVRWLGVMGFLAGGALYIALDEKAELFVGTANRTYVDHELQTGTLLLVGFFIVYAPATLAIASQRAARYTKRREVNDRLAVYSAFAQEHLMEADTPWKSTHAWRNEINSYLRKHLGESYVGRFNTMVPGVDIPQNITDQDHKNRWAHIQHRRIRLAEFMSEPAQ